MVSETAYTDRYHLVFIDSSERERAKFLYYMGAENEAELVALWKGVAIYEGISEERLEGFLTEDQD